MDWIYYVWRPPQSAESAESDVHMFGARIGSLYFTFHVWENSRGNYNLVLFFFFNVAYYYTVQIPLTLTIYNVFVSRTTQD